MLKVLIADDKAGMRLLLRKVVEKNNGYKVVGEAADGNFPLHNSFMDFLPKNHTFHLFGILSIPQYTSISKQQYGSLI